MLAILTAGLLVAGAAAAHAQQARQRPPAPARAQQVRQGPPPPAPASVAAPAPEAVQPPPF